MPWAWLVAGLLKGLGAMLSDIYSSPSKNLITFIGLSAVGWTLAGFITARASSGKSGMAGKLIAWAVAYLVAIPLGLVRMLNRDTVTFVLYLPQFVLAGVIGGFASSSRRGAWRLISGALAGFVFLLFSPIVTYYAGSLLMLFYSAIVHPYGDPISSSLISFFWVIPDTLFGLVAGFATRWILGMDDIDPTNITT